MAKAASANGAKAGAGKSDEMDDTRFGVKKKKNKAGPSPEQQLEDAKEKLESMVKNHFFRKHEARELPKFDRSELDIGPRLGIGGFCVVSEIIRTELNPDFDPPPTAAETEHATTKTMEESTEGEEGNEVTVHDNRGHEDNDSSGLYADDLGAADQHDHHYNFTPEAARAFISEHCLRDGDARYAIKKLRPDLSDREKENGIRDLAIEAKFLAVISHSNIIKMRGTATSASLSPNFFIVLDRLYGTLEEKFVDWSDLYKSFSGCCLGIGADKAEMDDLMVDRLTAAYDISTAFRYLHEHNIIYRDIKPENIGFDVRGDVKVFDFGLAKVLQRKDKLKDGLYKLTGLTGSRRYMAPEVAKCQNYNLMADAFSFGILLWQILSLKVPFEDFTPQDYMEQVCTKGYRPEISGAWPVFTREVIRECWSKNINDRPDFFRISNVLRGDMTDIADTTRNSIHNRTTHMMNRSQRSQRNFMRAIPAETTVAEDEPSGSNQNQSAH